MYDADEMGDNVSVQSRQANGYTTNVSSTGISGQEIQIDIPTIQSRELVDEPVLNTGLYSSIYDGDEGYYCLGSSGGYNYAPTLYGYLFRKYTKTYDGETRHWEWGAGETIAAISAYISLFGGPVSAVLGILAFLALGKRNKALLRGFTYPSLGLFEFSLRR